jgi:uncharacterized membrane protein
MVTVKRLLKHLFYSPMQAARVFPPGVLDALGAEVARSETRHRGEIRFLIEPALPGLSLLRGESPRARAQKLFFREGVADTQERNGVLLYLLLADRDLEIIVDAGVHAREPASTWASIAARMEAHYRAGRFLEGSRDGIAAVSEVLARHYPPEGANPNELPDRPQVL